MKDYFNRRKSKLLLLTLLTMLVVGASPTRADELTVYDGTAKNAYLPVYGYYVDAQGSSEFIIPSTDLTDLNGKNIERVIFYLESPASASWGSASFNVYLEEVEGENYEDDSSSQLSDSKTLVYAGALDGTGSTMEIPFTSNYTYNGGNLLVAIEVGTKGTYKAASFYGTTTSYNAGRYKYGSSSASRQKFIPKTTFVTPTNGPALTVKDGSKKLTSPYAYDFGLATAGTTHVFTLSNPGTAAVEGLTVSETGSFGATLSGTTIAAGGEVTLTVTMPETTGSSEVTISSTSDGIDDFVINVSGTIRDANKVYLDFADGQIPDGWTSVGIGSYTSSSYAWTASTGYVGTSASSSSYSQAFTSPILTFAKDELIAFETARYGSSTWYSPSITVEYSLDGTTWTAIGDAFTDDVYGTWTSRSVTIPVEGVKYIRFNGWYVYLRNIYGGEKPAGANFAIDTDGSTQNLGVASIGGVAEKKFTITNSGTTSLPVTFTDAADFYVAKSVMFTKPNSWTGDKLYMYVWDGSGALTAAWPGDEVTEAAQNDLGEWVYTARLPKGATGIKFSDNASHETGDISTADFKDVVGLWLDGSEIKTWKNEDFSVPADGSASFYVRMLTATTGTKNGSITLAFDALNATNFTIPVSGYVIDASKYAVDFNDNQLPDGWTNGTNNGASWTFANGEAYGQYANYKNAKMTSPLLTVAEGETMIFELKGNTSYADMKVNVFDKAGNSVKTVDFSDEARAAYSAGNFTTVMLSGLDAGDYRLEFEAYNTYIDNIIGFEINQNDPKMGVYTDADCTVAAATSVTRDFGFLTEAPAAFSYYIKNDGTGTMNLSNNTPAGFNVTLDKTAVAAGEHATLTIVFDANKGYHGGNVVVTAEGLGDFTVAVSGVVVDENKFDLDFTSADIPATWTKNNWEKNSNGYAEVGYNSSTMQTSTLVAEANETLVVVAKQSYTSSSYTFGVQYRQVGTETWNDLIPAANIGTSYVMLHGTIAEAGNYELLFIGNYTQIQRIYGLEKPDVPEMVVYDGAAVAAATYSFGKVTDEAAAEKVFTVKNEGKAEMTGLKAELSGDNADDYTVAVSAESVAAGESATVTVTQKAVVGTHAATLTISADGLESKVIALSGNTVDHTVLDVDFDASGEWPAEILAHDLWTIYNYNGSGEARQSSSSNAASLLLTPLTVSDATQKLSFQVASYLTYSSRDLTVNYTTDGGVTWTAYNFGTDETPATSLKDQITSPYKTFELTNIPAGTVAFDFNGKSIKIDNISGDYKVAKAPVVSFTEEGAAVADKDFGNLTADKTATYTLKNIGNEVLKSTITGEGITVNPASVELAAGESAEITVTMAYAAPYGSKTGKMTIESEGWVGNIEVNYTAEAVDPTSFVEDFENGKPAGWYLDTWSVAGGVARINSGLAKAMITEKIGAEAGKNTLSFDAKMANDYDGTYTLSVYTSADRKTWSEAQTFTLTSESQTFSLAALDNGEYYVKFEALNAQVDNIKGVKKLTAPTTDLYLVSSSMPTENVTPGSSYTATVSVASLVSEEVVAAELYFGESKVAELTEQTIANGATKTFTLTGAAPAAGTYDVYAKVYNDNGTVETDKVSVTVADTRIMAITAFTRTSDATVQADENNEFTATFDVTVQNTGTASLAANEVSVTLTNGTDAYENGTFIWTAENSDVLYMNTSNGTDDIATGCTLKAWCWNTVDDGVWTEFTKVNDGFYSLALNGKTNFIVCRVNPEGTDEDPWNNVYNKSGDLSLANGNLVKFSSWGAEGQPMNFSQESMVYLEPTMSTTLKLTLKLSAGEGGSFTFNAKENVSNTQYFMSQSVSVTPFATVALSETETYNATTESYGKVTLNRPFIAGWNTLVLPFDIDDDTFVEKFGDGAVLYTFTSNNDGKLTFTKTTEGVKAGTPYLLSLNAAITDGMTFTGVTVQPGTTLYQHDANSNGAEFKGNYVNGFNMEGKYGVMPAGKVQMGAAGSTMKAFRAYITMPEGVSGVRIAIFDVTTGISRVLTSKEVEDLNIFNLQGQRVGESAKGVVIKGGKKVVVK